MFVSTREQAFMYGLSRFPLLSWRSCRCCQAGKAPGARSARPRRGGASHFNPPRLRPLPPPPSRPSQNASENPAISEDQIAARSRRLGWGQQAKLPSRRAGSNNPLSPSSTYLNQQAWASPSSSHSQHSLPRSCARSSPSPSPSATSSRTARRAQPRNTLILKLVCATFQQSASHLTSSTPLPPSTSINTYTCPMRGPPISSFARCARTVGGRAPWWDRRRGWSSGSHLAK